LGTAEGTYYQDSERIKVELQTALGLSMSRDTVKRFFKKTIIRGRFGVPTASGGQPNPSRTP
jgi:hypothetical protein